MAYESFSVSELIPADPERIYRAWLDSVQHTAFTGEAATVEPFVGGKHTSFDGYAVGSTVELLPAQRIVQTWRATDFPPGSPDSRVEVTLEATVGGTMVTIFHTEIPGGQSDHYRDSWLKFYLEALKDYFTREIPSVKNGVPRPTKASAKPQAPARANKVNKVKPKVEAKARPKTPQTKKAKSKLKAKPKPKAKLKAKLKAKPKAKAKPKPKPKPKKPVRRR